MSGKLLDEMDYNDGGKVVMKMEVFGYKLMNMDVSVEIPDQRKRIMKVWFILVRVVIYINTQHSIP